MLATKLSYSVFETVSEEFAPTSVYDGTTIEYLSEICSTESFM
jgi:hypothetical protein